MQKRLTVSLFQSELEVGCVHLGLASLLLLVVKVVHQALDTCYQAVQLHVQLFHSLPAAFGSMAFMMVLKNITKLAQQPVRRLAPHADNKQ